MESNLNSETNSFYHDNYFILYQHINKPNGRKIYLGPKEGECRFCGKKSPDVTFKNVAHAIPESIGNRQLISNEECDDCNKFFSERIELHFDKYTKPFRIISKIKGKNGIPNYKSKDQMTRFDNGNINSKIEIKKITRILSHKDGSFMINHEDKTISCKFEIEPYIPLAVHKCFIKIALSLLPKECLCLFKNAHKCLMDENNQVYAKPILLLETFIPGHSPRPIDELKVTILFKNDIYKQVLSCILVIEFGNYHLQTFIPCDLDFPASNEETTKKIIYFDYPYFEENMLNIQTKNINLSCNEVSRFGDYFMEYSCDSIIDITDLLKGMKLTDLG